MANELKKDNIYLINSPAGSGKTTRIKSMIKEHIVNNPEDNILCITFTNRAADELNRDIDSSKIHISTIHSNINSFVSPFFTKKEIIDLYFDLYKTSIDKRRNDIEKNESNQKYIDKFGNLEFNTIRKNVTKLYYNESQFSNLYYGGLSHDDLLFFTYEIIKKFPKLKQKVSRKYQLIIIDEYQDTSPDVLHIFFEIVKGTSVMMYLFGDKMQQIYRSYDDELNKELLLLNNSNSRAINYRSIPVIVDILNNIYNNSKVDQEIDENNKNIKSDFNPQVIITEKGKFDECISKITKEYPETLVLYILNREKFKKIGCINLYNAYDVMEQYGYGKKYLVTDILLNNTLDNPDTLMRFLFVLYEINLKWKQRKYGDFLYICKQNKTMFNIKKLSLNKHDDKIVIRNLWTDVFNLFKIDDITIGQIINFITEKEIFTQTFVDSINSDDVYSNVFNVKISELVNLSKYLSSNEDIPYVSTQHGVKGESHDSVIFVAEDSKRNEPRVYIYDFFKVWSKAIFSLDDFENFYFKYSGFINKFEKELGFNIKKINKEMHVANKDFVIDKCTEIVDVFNSNDIFNIICRDIYETYLNNPNVGNASKCFQNNTVYGVLSAYKLFYVGCSRAKINLSIVVEKEQISTFMNDFVNKIKKVGFEIKYY